MTAPDIIVVGHIDFLFDVLLQSVPSVFQDALDDIVIVRPIVQCSFACIVQPGITYLFS